MQFAGDTGDTSPLLLASGGTDIGPLGPGGGGEGEGGGGAEEEDQLFPSSSSSEWGGYQRKNSEKSFV